MRYMLIRDVTKEECPWLDEDIPKGTMVYEYRGHTYGCIGPKGMAVSMEEGKTPFFEVPAHVLVVTPTERPDA